MPAPFKTRRSWIVLGVALALPILLGMGWFTVRNWRPDLLERFSSRGSAANGEAAADDGHHHDHDHDHDHDHGHDHAHDAADAVQLSEQARKNIGLKTEPVKLQTFQRTITVPAMVAERNTRTHMQVSARTTGVVSAIHVVDGQAIQPGQLLFQLQLTHEDLVKAQTEFLRELEELDVEKDEIARLQEVTQRGVVAGKTLLEREYARRKLEGVIRAQREALLLHGLTESQVDEIARNRRLLRELPVYAPSVPDDDHDSSHPSGPLLVENLSVHPGEAVTAGSSLCVLADYSVLFVEGRAFEQDAPALVRAANERLPITAIFESTNGEGEKITDLHVLYLGNRVEADSREFHFYVNLPNSIVRDVTGQNGRKFITWKYKPGQRLYLLVPVEFWENRLVVPVDAVVKDGAEFYAFRQNGDRFERVPVHLEYRDQFSAVIANDGSLFPGEVIAMTGAHQLQMALKNQAGGGIDPHAGHSH